MAQGGKPATLVDKIWNAHVILEREDGQTLIAVDRHYVHEGSHHGFAQVRARGARPARADLTFGFADHYAATRPESALGAPEAAEMVKRFSANVAEFGIESYGVGDPRRGIVHVAAPELGLTLPGLTIVCGDSDMSTHGACGAFAFGIGASEVAHVMMMQTPWQKRPKRVFVAVDGDLFPGVGAKDVSLSIAAKIGSDGARGHAIEYAGAGMTIAFVIDPAWKRQLLNGWDDIDRTLNETPAFAAFRARDERERPWARLRRATSRFVP